MRTTINIEFTDDELRKYAEDVGRRWGLNFIHDTIRHLAALKTPPGFMDALGQALAGLTAGSKPEVDPGPIARPRARPRAWTPSDPLPENPNAPDFAASDDRCERVESSPLNEEGWRCHHCDTYNGLQRVACRLCGHERCDVIVPPPPPPPQDPSDPSVQ